MLSVFYAQDNIKAEKEILSVLKYGTSNTFSELVGYDEEMDSFPKGPYIDNNGTLIFSFNQPPYNSIRYKNHKIELLKDVLIEHDFFPLSGQNINGITISSNQYHFFTYADNKIIKIYDFLEDENVSFDDVNSASYYYPLENSIVIEYLAHDHGPYRLGVVVNSDFTTKDKSKNYFMRKFLITRPDGTIEMTLEIPWSASFNYDEGKSFYSWSFGNWGELYSLIAPPMDSEGYWNNGKKEIELVVSRNYLKYFGILNDDRIRLRKGPGTNTESLGTYPIKTGFRILEKSGIKQTIGGVTDEWIKVRLLDGTEGYFFGQYVQNLYDGPGSPLPWPNVADWK